MRSLKEIEDDYIDFTRIASANIRTYSIASIGVIWLFRNPSQPDKILLDEGLAYALMTALLTLGIDALQYVFLGLSWKAYHSYAKGRTVNNHVSGGSWITGVGWSLFFLKSICFFASAYSLFNWFLRHFSISWQ